EINVSSKNNEVIKKLYVNEGDFVKEGELIAEINHSILDLQLIQAKANFNSAESDYKRTLEIYSSGNTSLKTKDDAENRYMVTRAGYEILKKQIEDCSIKAPTSGIITHKLAEKGEFVNVGTVIYTISKISPVYLNVYITEIQLGKVRLGMEAKIKIDSYPEKTFTGKIVFISPNSEFTPKNIQTKEERVKQVFRIKIEVPNDDMILKPGMPADALIELKE
ncbi:MAG: efflux RND transporter periplasmic adaptor subunit, partial [Spirochaetes bacterium]|nr:efflux RND transporter periplasmic adaptor subunit [Spirochaetota bacterium]